MATREVKTNAPGIDPATGEFRVIAQGETFRSVTDRISRIVLTPHTPLAWLGIFGIAGGGATGGKSVVAEDRKCFRMR